MQAVILTLLLITTVLCSDQIQNLPGLKNPPSFNQYAGYITVDDTAGRALYYWFTESKGNPSTDPLVIWQTGGPGCSSLLAMFLENGPFMPEEDGTLSDNEYSWNNNANVLWVESPAGVGFSYSNRTSDYIGVGDKRSAEDLYQFLDGFFKLYPQFKDNAFWITGESYGGHYVPNLAKKIVEENESGSPKINLKGFMVGNAWTYMLIDNLGAIDTWWQRAIVPESTVDEIKKYCNLSHYGPLQGVDPVKCNQATALSSKQMGDISIYDIYADVCLSDVATHFITGMANAGSAVHQVLKEKIDNTLNLSEYNPCRANWLNKYLNRMDVQKAIHVLNPTVHWSQCSGKVHYDYDDVATSVIPVYKYLLQKDLQMMVYSGDVDAIVPYLGSRNWIETLQLDIKEPWRPWHDTAGQVGGYVTVYDGLYFSTVRGAGHEVPSYQPDRASVLFNDFLNGKLPN